LRAIRRLLHAVNLRVPKRAAIGALQRVPLQWLRAPPAEQIVAALAMTDEGEGRNLARRLRENANLYGNDGRFSAGQWHEAEVRASRPGNLAARTLNTKTLVVDRWAGRKD
jgi:hypothetical protein